MNEQSIAFGSTSSLMGIVTAASDSAPASDERPGVVFVSAGLLHRVGPNRMYVDLARCLARAGFVSLRFDLSGVGDSLPSESGAPWDVRRPAEVSEAMDSLSESNGLRRFVLVGLCSGADTAFLAARLDDRVAGIVLLNPSLTNHERTEEDIERAEAAIRARYYRTRALDPRSWLRVLRGKSNLRAILKTVLRKLRGRAARAAGGSTEAASRAAPVKRIQTAEPWFAAERDITLFALYAEGSMGWDVSQESLRTQGKALEAEGRLEVEMLRGADHVFTLDWTKQYVIARVDRWMNARFGSSL